MGWFARKRSGLVILLGLAAAAALAVNRIHLGGAAGKLEEIASRFLSFFLCAFSVGMIVATLKPDRWKNAARSMPAAVVAFAMIGITVFFVKPAYGWLESLALALPFACVCFGNSWFGLLTSGPLRFLGRTSYSFYLLHMLVLTAGLRIIGKYVQVSSLGAVGYWGYALLFGLVAIIVSSFSYQYFEHPLLHVGRPAVKRIVFATGHAPRSALAAKADTEHP
jgi:peptidoglycan/LPS O-acetylase OafA/YrhL